MIRVKEKRLVVGIGNVSTTMPACISFDWPVSTTLPLKFAEKRVRSVMGLVMTIGTLGVEGEGGSISLFFLQPIINTVADKAIKKVFIIREGLMLRPSRGAGKVRP